MSESNPTVEYADLLKRYRELADAVHMVRRAAERAARANVLPSLSRDFHAGMGGVEECEMIARALYAAGARELQARRCPQWPIETP